MTLFRLETALLVLAMAVHGPIPALTLALFGGALLAGWAVMRWWR